MIKEEREKHLDWLYRLKSEIFVFMPKDWIIPFADALDVAIKALEQEPCEDAISRQTVLDELNKWDWQELYLPIHFKEYIIDVVPPVKPQEPKTGQWIIIDDCEQFIAKCSECGRIEDSRMISKYPYCHCGAKMVESQEGGNKE